MRAALLHHPGRIETVDVPEPPAPRVGEVLVAVRRVGICGTDHHAFAGTQNFFRYPRVLGHELAVEVLEVGAGVDTVRVGDRCAVLPYLSCGRCPACRRGRGNCCERIGVLGVTLDGGLCERLVVPAEQLYRSDSLSLDQLALVETLGVGQHAVERGRPRPADTALVLGAGPIGLAVAQCLHDRVKEVLVGDLSAARLEFAAGLGQSTVLVDDTLPERVLDQDGALPSLVFDATGSAASMERAFTLVGAGGTLVLVGHTTGTLRFENPGFHARELDLRGSRNALPRDWEAVLAAVALQDLDALPWINHRSSLESISADLPALANGSAPVVKTVVEIGGTG